jgi:AraC-like DNA-binding protein
MSETCKEEFGYYYSLIRSKINNHNTPPPNEIIQTLIRALLLELCSFLGQITTPILEHKISQGKLLFNRFLSMLSGSNVKRLPINYYAGQLAITPKYLTMLCLKYSDKTASDWIVQYTLEDIRFYLRNTDFSIKEVSAKLGFANMSHFGSYVRKHLGVSPSEYRSHTNEV